MIALHLTASHGNLNVDPNIRAHKGLSLAYNKSAREFDSMRDVMKFTLEAKTV